MKISTFFIIILMLVSSAFAEEEQEAPKLILEEITCVGNQKTKCRLIKKELRLKVEDEVDQDDLRNGKIRLSLLGLFESVDLSLEKGSERGRVKLLVEVDEASSYYTITDIGLGGRENDSDLGFTAQNSFTVGNRNLFGKGKRVYLTYSGSFYDKLSDGKSSNYHSLRLNYTDPNLFGSSRFFGKANLYYNKSNRTYGDSESGYVDLELGYRFRKFSYVSLKYLAGRYAFTNDNDFVSKTDFEVGDIRLQYGYNTQDDLYFPTQGSRFNARFRVWESYDYDETLNWKLGLSWLQTWRLSSKYYLTGFAGDFSEEDNTEFLNSGFGVEIAKQVRRNNTSKDVSDLRFYTTPSLKGYSGFTGMRWRAAVGVKLRSKKYGLAKLELFYRGDSE